MTQSTDLEFSHMPEVGVSYGVQKVGDTALLSVAFTNDSAGDVFSKKRARQIITGRIRKCLEHGHKKALAITSLKTARQIVKDMRLTFKPAGNVNESCFATSIPLGKDKSDEFPIKIVTKTRRLPRDGSPSGGSVWEKLVSEFKRVA